MGLNMVEVNVANVIKNLFVKEAGFCIVSREMRCVERMVIKVLMCSFVNASYNAFCVGVYVNGLCMVWEGCGHGDAKYFGGVVIGCGRGGEVDFDGDDISIMPRCCD